MFICDNCKTELIYKAEVATPGYGRTYTCPNCNEIYLKIGEYIRNWKYIEPDIFEWEI